MTQSWGSVGTIIVGISAMVVAIYWNRRTLKRTDERYENDRQEAHSDKVREAVVELVHQTTLWAGAAQNCRSAVRRAAATPPATEQATAETEQRLRDALDAHSAAQMNLRRAIWSAQLIVDDPYLRAGIDKAIEIQTLVRDLKRDEWATMPVFVDELHELRIQMNEHVDDMLQYAQTNLAKARAGHARLSDTGASRPEKPPGRRMLETTRNQREPLRR